MKRWPEPTPGTPRRSAIRSQPHRREVFEVFYFFAPHPHPDLPPSRWGELAPVSHQQMARSCDCVWPLMNQLRRYSDSSPLADLATLPMDAVNISIMFCSMT